MLVRIHLVAALAFVAAIVVQVFLAGAAIANLGGSGNFSGHVEFGYTGIGIVVAILLVTALVARLPRRDLGLVVLLVVLYVVQTLLPGFRSASPAIAALHPVNALFLFGGASWYALRLWRRATT